MSEEKSGAKKKKILEIVQRIDMLGVDIHTFKKVIESIEQISDYAMIVHDKDENADGTLKEPHVHCAVRMKNANAPKTLSHWVLTAGANVNDFNIEYAKGRFMHMLAYLTHANAPEKYQYDDGEVISNFEWKKEAAKVESSDIDELIRKIETGEIREYNKTKHIPVEMVVRHETMLNRAFKWRADKMVEEIKEGIGEGNMAIDVIYIEGESGAGKTTYAKQICKDRGYSYCVSSSANDPLQDYKGEDALILDDLRGTSMVASDLLKLLDNHTRSSVRSRYNNKWLYECKAIIITSIFALEEFFESMQESNKEPIEQFKRRCETRIKMTKERIIISAYNSDEKAYEVVANADNNVIEEFEKEKAKKAEKAKSFLISGLKNVTIIGNEDAKKKEKPTERYKQGNLFSMVD